MIAVRANVTMPSLKISDDVVDFADVKCGECRVITVQLHNDQHVRCEWSAAPVFADKDKNKVTH